MDEMVKRVDVSLIRRMLKQKAVMREFLSVCASCGACADSCFYYRNTGDPLATPSYKALRSLGTMFRKRGRLSIDELENMKDIIWGRCVLCGRCHCPMGIDVAAMISWARSICRAQGVCEDYEKGPMGI